MTARVTTLLRIDVTSLTTSVSTVHFLIEMIMILKTIKVHSDIPYDTQNLTLVVISDEIYETRRRHFLIEMIMILKAIKVHSDIPYDTQNLTLVVISDEIYETRRRLVS